MPDSDLEMLKGEGQLFKEWQIWKLVPWERTIVQGAGLGALFPVLGMACPMKPFSGPFHISGALALVVESLVVLKPLKFRGG